MRIQVGGLSDGVYQHTLAEDAATMELGSQFQDQVVARVTIEKSGTQIFLKTALSLNGSFTCDRCLSPFLSSLTPSYRMCYVTEGGDDSNMDPAELQVVPPGFSVIDMTDDVRQTVLLSVPLKLLCSENCKGLCPHCGMNLNFGTCTCTESVVDPRWEQLIKLKKQL